MPYTHLYNGEVVLETAAIREWMAFACAPASNVYFISLCTTLCALTHTHTL